MCWYPWNQDAPYSPRRLAMRIGSVSGGTRNRGASYSWLCFSINTVWYSFLPVLVGSFPSQVTQISHLCQSSLFVSLHVSNIIILYSVSDHCNIWRLYVLFPWHIVSAGSPSRYVVVLCHLTVSQSFSLDLYCRNPWGLGWGWVLPERTCIYFCELLGAGWGRCRRS